MLNIAAGIVLYNPDLIRLKENIDSIYDQVDRLILVDNNSCNIKYVEEIYNDYKKILFIKNNENVGVSKALNQIMDLGNEMGCKWVMTLDQDSVCPTNIIEEYKKYINISKLAIISPIIIDRNRDNSSLKKVYKNEYELIDKCITAGALTNVSVWKEVKGFDEEMFIDLVDFEYCKRVTLKGYKIIKLNTVDLLHEIGNITYHKFFWFKIAVKNHSSFRKYYMARNIIYFSKKYEKRNMRFIAYLRILKILILTLMYEENKYDKYKSIIKGVKSANKLVINKTYY